MKQFKKAILVTCANCYHQEAIAVETVKEAKSILEKNYSWKKVENDWVCSECVE